MMRLPASTLLLFASSLLLAMPRMPATTRAGLDRLNMLAQAGPDPAKLTHATQGNFPTALVHGRCMVGFLGLLHPGADLNEMQHEAIRWGARQGDIVSFRVDARQLDAINSLSGLAYMELAGHVVPTLDRVLGATRVDSVHLGIHLPQAYTGRDVLIGVTDWGFDYTHPMFYDTALTATRIRAAWDQFKQSGPAPPGFSYGTEYTSPEELLTAKGDTANIYSWATHGTHVSGIAGGGGAGTAYRGIAFEAEFLFTTFLVDAAAVLDAWTWMHQIAQQDGKRLVVNMSWGLHWIGTLDGTSLLSQAMAQLAAEGVVFVTSAGNNGGVDFHLTRTFPADTLRSRVAFYSYASHPHMWGQSISLWGEPGATFSAGFSLNNGATVLQESPWYHTATQAYYLDSLLVQGNDTILFNLTCDAAHPLNGRPHFRLRIHNRSTIHVVLQVTATAGTVHAWNVTELDNDVGNWGQAFLGTQPGWTQGDRHYGIGEPACAEDAIAVAAYSAEYINSAGNPLGGGIANFSSFGPTLDGRLKPDITAPGVNVASSISAWTNNAYTAIQTINFQGVNYPFARFSGTSMSSPAVAGIAALLLEADPSLTPQALKQLLQATARTDSFTGEIPPEGSTRWGMGKVNAYHAMLELLGLVGVPEIGPQGIGLWPNPAMDQVFLSLPEDLGAARITVQDAMGRVVTELPWNGAGPMVLEVAGWPAGLYVVRASWGGQQASARFIKP